MAHPRVPSHKVRRILDEYASGASVKNIAADHDVSDTFVSKIANRYGMRRQYHRMSIAHANKVKAAVADYAAGVPVKIIMFRYSVSGTTLRAMALKQGVGLRQSRKSKGTTDVGTIRNVGAG